MLLHSLSIQHFRNLTQVEFSPSKTINLITGDNASGKTSLLESIYYLSHLRSFRTQFISDLIQRDQPYLQLVASLHQQESNIPLGIRRSRSRCEIRVNRQPVKRVSDIAAQFPVIAIHPDSYILIAGSPAERRQFLDWGVFHVEHGFFKSWQRYRKAVQQRNAALKAKQKPEYCQLWNQEICRTAVHIDSLRKQYYASLVPYLNDMMSVLFKDDDISITYRRGWPADQELSSLLEQNLHRERLKGYTYYGPHRADLVIRVNGQSAQTCISRGQQKTLVALMRLAQAKHFTATTNSDCVLLYDDLAAELDSHRRSYILSVLNEMKVQLFLTAIEANQIDISSTSDIRMFHVEQGSVTAV
jgi:DNA replication and repair protein RecF